MADIAELEKPPGDTHVRRLQLCSGFLASCHLADNAAEADAVMPMQLNEEGMAPGVGSPAARAEMRRIMEELGYLEEQDRVDEADQQPPAPPAGKA